MAVITNLRFADGVDALAEKELELEAQATKLSANDTQREIKVKEQKLGRVTRFKYHTAVVYMMALNRRFPQGLHKPLNSS